MSQNREGSLLKLTGSVYGLRNAPRAWYRRVKKDLEALGWRCHQLDQCVFLKYDGEELVGICGVYVDDFIISGKRNGQKWQKEKDKIKKMYKWGKWESDAFTPLWSPLRTKTGLLGQNGSKRIYYKIVHRRTQPTKEPTQT